MYRYQHEATERWRGGCLESIHARTDDDGSVAEVSGVLESGRLVVETRSPGRPASPSRLEHPGPCIWSFAYWNPELRRQGRLLDPGSGQLRAVAIEPLPARSIRTDDGVVSAGGIRIAGTASPIDVWYSGARWVGLDTKVAGGRTLSYRLRK